MRLTIVGCALIPLCLWPSEAALARQLMKDVRLTPERIEFERAAPAEVIPFTFELTNDSEYPVRITKVHPNCPCTVPIGFQPVSIAPGQIQAIPMQIEAPEVVDKDRTVTVFLFLDSGLVLKSVLEIHSVDPRIARVDRYLRARREHNEQAAQQQVAPDARRWFLSREGSGRPFFTRGSWADWDDLFNSSFEVRSIELDGAEAVVNGVESNDFYRLIDRAPTVTQSRYWFDSSGRIVGSVFLGRPEGEPRRTDRLEQFTQWLQRHDPDALAFLMPEGEIDPALEKARRWKELLVRWRREAGLPEAVLVEDGA